MPKVRRRLIASGEWYDVECAVREDGVTSPVADFIDALKLRQWAFPEGSSSLAPDEQVKAYAWFIAEVEYFAETGEMHSRRSWNQLRDGIWEFKRHQVRVSFYDTDGNGAYAPKLMERVYFGGGSYCPLPNFDEYIRLGTVFEKNSQETPEGEIALAKAIRDEDLNHDRTQ